MSEKYLEMLENSYKSHITKLVDEITIPYQSIKDTIGYCVCKKVIMNDVEVNVFNVLNTCVVVRKLSQYPALLPTHMKWCDGSLYEILVMDIDKPIDIMKNDILGNERRIEDIKHRIIVPSNNLEDYKPMGKNITLKVNTHKEYILHVLKFANDLTKSVSTSNVNELMMECKVKMYSCSIFRLFNEIKNNYSDDLRNNDTGLPINTILTDMEVGE